MIPHVTGKGCRVELRSGHWSIAGAASIEDYCSDTNQPTKITSSKLCVDNEVVWIV